MKKSILAALALSCASLLPTTASFANEGDVQACDGKTDGDDCTRSDGGAGTCQPDESDPAVLTCEDTGADDEACTGKADGDACTRSDGSAGTCEPDDSDPAHLHCEDGSSSSSGSGSCSITAPGAASAPVSYAAALAIGLAALLGRARRPATAPARRRR